MKRKHINNAFESVILILAIAACVLFILSLLSLVSSCSNDKEPSQPIETPIENKQYYELSVNGDQREYIVYVPSHYDAMNNYPLVFQLHGGSGDGEKYYNISGWNELAETHAFLVAYPTAWAYDLNKNGCGNNLVTGWNDYEQINEVCPNETLKDDVAFFDQMIDQIGTDFSVDSNKIYVSGFSNGGGMASRLAIELSDRLAAVGMLAGTFPEDTTAVYVPKRILPIQLMIGTADDKIAEVTSFQDQLPMDLPQVLADPYISDLLQTWVETFNLDPNYVVTDDAGSEITVTYTGNSGDPDHLLRFTLLEDVGHFFPNPDDEPGAADLLWEFFEPYKLK